MSSGNGVQLGAGENIKEKTLKVYDYQITDIDSETGQSYIKDIGRLADINLNIVNVADAINTLIDTDEDTVNLITNEVSARIEADKNIKKEIPVKTIENITSETTDNSSYVTPLMVKNAVNNLIESSEEIKNITDGLNQKADKVTNGAL